MRFMLLVITYLFNILSEEGRKVIIEKKKTIFDAHRMCAFIRTILKLAKAYNWNFDLRVR